MKKSARNEQQLKSKKTNNPYFTDFQLKKFRKNTDNDKNSQKSYEKNGENNQT